MMSDRHRFTATDIGAGGVRLSRNRTPPAPAETARLCGNARAVATCPLLVDRRGEPFAARRARRAGNSAGGQPASSAKAAGPAPEDDHRAGVGADEADGDAANRSVISARLTGFENRYPWPYGQPISASLR
jgi:hypothetical protein